MLRVVFDSSAFRPETFDLLEKSQLSNLYKKRQILPIYSPLFLEEVSGTYGIAGKRAHLLNRWLPFIQVTTDRLIDELPRIFHKELVEGKCRKADFHMRIKVQKFVFSKLRNAPEDGSWEMWSLSKGERDNTRNKRITTYEIVRSMREHMSEWRKTATQEDLNSPTPPFELYVSHELDNAGRLFIPRLIEARNPTAIADRWAKSKGDYPFFTGYVRNVLYLAYYAMTKPNSRLDPNAAADLEIMLNLLHADALVSDDMGFMRIAFDDLWKPKGKLLFSVQEFIQFIQ